MMITRPTMFPLPPPTRPSIDTLSTTIPTLRP
jgi:hypothetical protein